MKTYSLTINMSQEQFVKFLEGAGELRGAKLTITEDNTNDLDQGAPTPAAAKPVRKRTSKINEALLDCLTFGTKNVSELKQALVEKGLSANSLSTGLAALQKSGEVVSKGDGAYALATAA